MNGAPVRADGAPVHALASGSARDVHDRLLHALLEEGEEREGHPVRSGGIDVVDGVEGLLRYLVEVRLAERFSTRRSRPREVTAGRPLRVTRLGQRPF